MLDSQAVEATVEALKQAVLNDGFFTVPVPFDSSIARKMYTRSNQFHELADE